MKTILEKLTTPVVHEADVVVAGGGPAGIIAAVAAARNGARTILVEKNGFLGGVASTGIPIQGFHVARRKQIVGGFPLELIERLVNEKASAGFAFFKGIPKIYGTYVLYDHFQFRTIVARMLKESGVTIFLHTTCVEPVIKRSEIKGIIIENKSGRQAILCKTVIDATGDGDIAARAGAEFQKGNQQGYMQPCTRLFRLGGVDMQAFLGDIDRNPQDYELTDPAPDFRVRYQNGERLLINGLERLCRKAQARGEYDAPNPLVAIACLPRKGEVLVNMAHIKPCDATNAGDITKAILSGDELVWQMFHFLRKYVKGFRHAYIVEIPPYLGVRESRRIVGDHVLHEREMTAREKFPDRICMGGRGVDLHDPTPGGTQNCGASYRGFPSGYYIPYRSLLPKGLNNILMAGRCISVSYIAFGSTRVMAQCMATGQAAGTAAALATKNNCAVREINIGVLQRKLRQQDAIVD